MLLPSWVQIPGGATETLARGEAMNEKHFQCDKCNWEFASKASRAQHKRDKHGPTRPQGMSKEGAKAVMEEMDDLSDGAWLAMAESLGLRPEDL
jgi:hypothetical protein